MVLQGLQLTDPHLGPGRQQPRPRPRPRRAGQRLPVAGSGRRARAALRLPRRVRAATRRAQALAGVGAARAHAPPVRVGPRVADADVRRARCAGDRPHAGGRRLPVPAAGVPARRRDRRRGVVAPDDRRARPDVAPGRAPRRRRGCRRRARCAASIRADDADCARPRRPSPPHARPAGLRRWMATEVWRRQPATRLRPLRAADDRARRRRSRSRPGPLLWLAAIGEPGRARPRRPLADACRPRPTAARRRPAHATARSRSPTSTSRSTTPSRLVVGQRLAAEGVVAPVWLDAPLRVRRSRRRERGEPVMATASQVSAWLLVEVNGPWGRDAIVQSELGPHAPAVWRQAMQRQGHPRDRHPPRPRPATSEPRAARARARPRRRRRGPGSATAVASRRVIADLHEVVVGHGVAGRRPRARRRLGARRRPLRARVHERPPRRLLRDVRPAARARRCASRSGPTRSGSARTSAATASPATSCCCPTACTSGTATRRRRAGAGRPRRRSPRPRQLPRPFDVPPAEQAAEHFVRARLGARRARRHALDRGRSTTAATASSSSTVDRSATS